MGGLSVALDATADEVLGPVLAELGGDAQRKLRVDDVRTGPPLTLEVRLDGIPHSWEAPDLRTLVTCINEAFAPDPAVRTCVVLGEWEDMMQLWCLDKRTRRRLERELILPDR